MLLALVGACSEPAPPDPVRTARRDFDTRLGQLAAELATARAQIERAATAGERTAARYRADELSRHYDALLAQARAFGEASIVDTVRDARPRD